MRSSLLAGLLVGLFAWLGLAANLDNWEVDGTCTAHRAALEKAYNDAEVMAVKALQDLEFVRQPRPARFTRANRDTIRRWDRIARAVTTMFGFQLDTAGHAATETHMANVLYVYERMVSALRDGNIIPQNGYSGQHARALIMCDTSRWQYVRPNDRDPQNPALTLIASKPQVIGASAGVWYYRDRYLQNPDPSSVGTCRQNVYAVTQTRYDVLTFCPYSFDPASNVPGSVGPVDGRANVQVGDTLDSYGSTSLSRIMIHELAHWYGSDGQGLLTDRHVDDKQAVGNAGALIWYNPATQRLQNTDTYKWASKLSKTNQPPNDVNSGPAIATFNAENYALFGMMAYMDNFDWADDGQAKALPNP
ncbi:hypothetical protein ACJ41O_011656 [Fusarium nematophilum]